MNQAAQQPKRVAVIVPPVSDHAINLIRGILTYRRRHTDWQIHTEGVTPVLAWDDLPAWDGDGIIAGPNEEHEAERLRACDVPAVNASADFFLEGIPSVIGDGPAIGALAAGHLLEQQLSSFVFMGNLYRPIDRDRYRGFADALQAAGHTCDAIGYTPMSAPATTYAREQIDVQPLAERIAALPKPLGVFAPHDDLGCWVIKAAVHAGLKVPDDVAVVGVNNHELLCESAQPPLSSIVQPAEQIGYRAAQTLDLLMAGEAPPRPVASFPPQGLVTRASSQRLAIRDEVIVRALRFIQNNADQAIDVAAVTAEVPLSRRALEVRFKKLVGRTVNQEIQRVHMERAKGLLLASDWTIARIGLECGYETRHGFTKAFEQVVGASPRAFRKEGGGRKAEGG